MAWEGSHSSFEFELVSKDECEEEGEVSEVKASENGSLRGRDTEDDFEGDLYIGE